MLHLNHTNWWVSNSDDPILRLEHDHRVTANDDHPDLLLLAGLAELGRLVQHEIHEGVEAAEDPFHSPATVDLQVDLQRDKRLLTTVNCVFN